MSKRAQFWLGILISVVCLALIFSLVDLGELWQELKSADWRVVAVILAGQVWFVMLRVWRWQIMLGTAGERPRFWSLFHAQNIGYLITNLLPFRLGDLARSYLAGLEPELDIAKSLSSVVLERVLDMLIIVILFGAVVPLAPSLPDQLAIAGRVLSVAAVLGFLMILLAAAQRPLALKLARWALDQVKALDTEVWVGRADSFLDGFSSLTRWRLLLPVLGLSLLIWAGMIVTYYFSIRGFWPDGTWLAAVVTLCAAAFGISVPSSPGAIGVFDGAIILGLSAFSIEGSQATGFALVYHGVMYLQILFFGLFSLAQSGHSLGAIVDATRSLGKA